MASKYYDSTAVINVIGCVFNNPSLLDYTEQYNFTDEDFANEFHRVVFGAIYKIYELGAKKITLTTIADYLSSKPKSEAIYKKDNGDKWLLAISEKCNQDTFNYYCHSFSIAYNAIFNSLNPSECNN